MDHPYTGPQSGPGIASDRIIGAEGLRAAMGFAEMIVDTVREGLLVLNLDLVVQAANESFYRMFGVTREATEGQLVYEMGDGRWNDPALRELLERILPERHVFDDFEMEQTFEDGRRRVILLNARQLNHHEMVLLAFEDVTERVQAREALEQSREELEQKVHARTRQVRQLATKLSVAEQEERRRIAHVLHDDLQQQLYGASMTIAVATQIEAAEERTRILERVSEALEQARHAVRTLASELSPSVLEADSLGDVLRWLAERKRERFGLHVTVDGEAMVEDPALRTLLYHLVREALFNVTKHAGTDQARVRLADAPDGSAIVSIEDSGAGFDVARLHTAGGATGFGLSSIQERLEVVGGHLTVEAEAGRGTRITMTLPRGEARTGGMVPG